MATQQPVSPLPPRPPRHGPLIALLVLALIIAAAVLALFYGVRLISRSVSVHQEEAVNGTKRVTIKTPAGDIHVNQGAQIDPALLGLPLYPGAHAVQDNKDSARVSMQLPGNQMLGVATAKFETPDSIDMVRAYYRDQLKGEITKTTNGRFGDSIAFEIKHGDLERVVALKKVESGTQITLVRARHSASEAN